jgi:hypothetical protein
VHTPEIVGVIVTLILTVFAVMGIGSRKQFPNEEMQAEVRNIARKVWGTIAVLIGLITLIIWL